MDDGARFSTQQPPRVSWAQSRALWDSLLPTSRGDNTVPSTFPTESLSTHAPLGQHIREEKKEKKEEKKRKRRKASITLQEMHFSNTNSFPTGWRRKTSHQLLPLTPRGSAWDPRLAPADLPSSLLGTRTRAFPAQGKGWEREKGWESGREGGGLGAFLNNQPSEWQQQ